MEGGRLAASLAPELRHCKFVLMLRMYWPNENSPGIINGAWSPPPVKKAGSA